MKKRNLFVVLVLSFITLGLYGLFWLYFTRRDILRFLPDKKAIPSFWVMAAPVLILLGLATLALIINALSTRSGGNPINGVLLLVGIPTSFATLVVPFWWMWHYFKAVYALTAKAGQTGTEVWVLYLLWIASILVAVPVWMLLVQNDLNKLADQLAAPQPAEPPSYTHVPMA
jgi:hypothetical protein